MVLIKNNPRLKIRSYGYKLRSQEVRTDFSTKIEHKYTNGGFFYISFHLVLSFIIKEVSAGRRKISKQERHVILP